MSVILCTFPDSSEEQIVFYFVLLLSYEQYYFNSLCKQTQKEGRVLLFFTPQQALDPFQSS